MPQKDAWPSVPSSLKALCEQEGLAYLGVSDVSVHPHKDQLYQRWLEQGNHGEMAYLQTHAPLKYHPETLLDGCRSLLMVGWNYFQEGQRQPGEGWVARYAWGRDYHRALGGKLRRLVKTLQDAYPQERFRSFTDAGPLDERAFAESGGLGFMGRHHLIISSVYGSWFFLGEILSTIPWEPTPFVEPVHGACPRGCRKCLDVCPTGALRDDGTMEAHRCLSYLTIEFKGSLPLEFRKPMGSWIFGCDLCQEVCPFQLRKKHTNEPDLLTWKAGPGISLVRLLTMDQDAFTQKFADSPVMRAGLRMMKRNACIAAGNTRDITCLGVLQNLALGEDPLLAEHAQWALAQYKENETHASH